MCERKEEISEAIRSTRAPGKGPCRRLKKVSIFTDGACRGNPGPGGYGVILIWGAHRRELQAGFERTTNNRMELLAAIAGLDELKQACRVTLTSDSRYLVDAMTKGWLRGWKHRGWRRGPGKRLRNEDLWRQLDFVQSRHEVSWTWLRGHAGHPENERCDQLAVQAAVGDRLLVDEGYLREEALSSVEEGLL